MKLRAFQKLLFRFWIEDQYLQGLKEIEAIGNSLGCIYHGCQRRLAQ